MRRTAVLASAGAALMPFLVLAFYTWSRDGRPAGLVAMLGRGDLLPPAALLAAHSLTALAARPVHHPVLTALNWALFAMACATFTVPFSGASGYERRLAYLSLLVFALVVVVSPPRGPDPPPKEDAPWASSSSTP